MAEKGFTLALAAARDYPTKTAAWKVAKPLKDALENHAALSSAAPMVRTLVEQYRAEKMPQRQSTRQGYEVWFRSRILPR